MNEIEKNGLMWTCNFLYNLNKALRYIYKRDFSSLSTNQCRSLSVDFAFLSWTVLRIYSKKNSLWWVYVGERLWSYITSISVCKKCRMWQIHRLYFLLWTIAHDFLDFDRFQSYMVQSKDSTFFLLIVPRKSGPSEMRIGFSNTLKTREVRIIFSCFSKILSAEKRIHLFIRWFISFHCNF